MLHLKVAQGSDPARTLSFGADVVRLGRAEGNDLVVSEWHVSGEHALVLWAEDHHLVRDLQSTNGTRIVRSGELIDVGASVGREATLRSGDVLLLGDAERPVRIEVRIEEDAEEARIVTVRRLAELEQVEADLGADGQVLRALYEAQKALSGSLDLDELVDALAARVFGLLSRATHVTVAMREEDEHRKAGRYVAIGSRVRGGGGTAPVPITRSVVKKVVAERAAVLAADARRDVGETVSIMSAQILLSLIHI